MSLKNRRLDASWDYTFGAGVKNYLTDREAVAQAIKQRLLLLYKEWWEDLEDGLPLFEKILASSGSEQNRAAVDIIFTERIKGTRDVERIVEFSSSYQNRQYIFSCTVDTKYGEIYVTNEEA